MRFDKESGEFEPHYFENLDGDERTFLAMRQLYDLIKPTEKLLLNEWKAKKAAAEAAA